MSDIRYVVVSDLHLGAKYSVLTRIDPVTGEMVPTEPSTTLTLFAESLKKLVREQSDTKPPTLILLGDILDMAFSTTSEVAMGFTRFIEALFPVDQAQIFSDQIIVVPGNHDHHLWNAETDYRYIDQIRTSNSEIMPDLTEITAAFEPPRIDSTLLTELMRRTSPHLADARVSVAYPNLGLLSQDKQRCVVLHHGHFVEPVYRMMTEVAAWFDGRGIDDKTVLDLERENGSWIDFLWSSIGSAGGISSDVLQLYEMMQDTAVMHAKTATLSKRIVHSMNKFLPMAGLPDVPLLSRRVIKGLLDLSVGRASQMERSAYETCLSKESLHGLRWYLEHPVYATLGSELGDGNIPDDVAFIWGHTHKPFEDVVLLDYQKYRYPVKIYNTGGWVVDQPRLASTQGAAVVILDEALNIASVRLFNNTLEGEASEVRANYCTGSDNTLRQELQNTIDQTPEFWDAFSKDVHASLALRAELMSRKYFDPEMKYESQRGGI